MRIRIAFVSFAFLWLSVAFAAELRVPEQHATIQAALDAAAAGDVITVGEGIFKENLSVKVPVTLRGVGTEKTIVRGNAAVGPVITVDSLKAVQLVAMQFFMVGTKSVADGDLRHVVFQQKGGDVTVEDCLFQNGASNGVAVDSDGQLTAKGSSFFRNVGHGIGISDAKTNVVLENCFLNENGACGAIVLNGATVRATQSVFEKNAVDGLSLYEANGFAEACKFTENNRCGFIINRCASGGATGCNASRNKASGLAVGGEPSEFMLRDNVSSENDYYGIFVDTGARPTLQGNTCRGNKHAGIFATHIDTKPKIIGNECTENAMAGIYLYQGASGTITKNNCTKNKQGGISVGGLDSSAEISENSCRENLMAGISVSIFAKAVLRGNELTGNDGFGILKTGFATVEESENALHGNTQGEKTESDYLPDLLHLETEEFQWCVNTKRFARLERLRENFSKYNQHNQDGGMALESLYEQITYTSGQYEFASYDAMTQTFDAWQAAFPKSSAPATLRFKMYKRAAWRARGSGFSNEVTEKGWKEYRKQMGYAGDQLKLNEESGLEFDQMHHVEKLDYLVDISAPRTAQREALQDAVKAFPKFAPFYVSYARGLSEYWSDEVPEVNKFLAEIPEMAGADAAPDVTARVLTVLMLYGGLAPTFREQYKFDYAIASPGFEYIVSTFPRFRYAVDAYALAACVNKDMPKAKVMFDRIKDNFGARIWQEVRNYQRFRDWANGDTPYPKRLAGETADVPSVFGGKMIDLISRIPVE